MDEVKNATQSYKQWSVTEIVREIKEDFLSASEETLQHRGSEQTSDYELPDG
jgi:hypothetical protein